MQIVAGWLEDLIQELQERMIDDVWEYEKERIATLGLGPLLDFLRCGEGIYEGIW